MNTGYRSNLLMPDSGAEYLIKITGNNGIIRSKGLYQFDHDKSDWALIKNIKVGKDINRLETQVGVNDINFQGSDQLEIYFLTTDWSESFVDLSDGLIMDSNDLPNIKSINNNRGNNPYNSNTIHPTSAQNSDSDSLNPAKLDELEPGDGIYEISGDTNEPNPDWIEVTFPSINIPTGSTINNITYYYGYYTNDGWGLTTDPLSNITWNTGGSQHNLYNYSLSSPADTDYDLIYSQQLDFPPINELNSGIFSIRFRGIENGLDADNFYLDYCYFTINYTIPSVVINEIMFDPTGNDNNSEWVELYNPGNTAIDLTGWNLTDNDGNMFSLTGAGTIPSKGYLVCHLGQIGTDNSTDIFGTLNRTLYIQPGPEDGKDTMILGSNPNDQYNYGADTIITISNSTTIPKRILIEFDLSTIPSYSVIEIATFHMYKHAGAGGIATLTIHSIINTWCEGSGLSQPNSNSVNGTSWLERWYDNNANDGNDPWNENDPDWANKGGDYNQNVEATSTVGNFDQWVNWTITDLVQKWVNGSIPNNGFFIFNDLIAGKEFCSSDYASNISRRPKIIINCTINTMLENDDDDLALIDHDGKVIDYVAWGADPGEDDDAAAAAGQWDNGDYVPLYFFIEGNSIGRDWNSTDTDQPADWVNSAGSSPTPGCPNVSEFQFIIIPATLVLLISIIINKKIRKKKTMYIGSSRGGF
jgi:hypothetical protein